MSPWEIGPSAHGREPVGFAPRTVAAPANSIRRWHEPNEGSPNSDSPGYSMDDVPSSATTEAESPRTSRNHVLGMNFSLSKHGPEKEVCFTTKPLGMAFAVGKKPFIVKTIERGGNASGLGIRPGMTVKSIQGRQVGDMEYEEFIVLLNSESSALVPSGAKQGEWRQTF